MAYETTKEIRFKKGKTFKLKEPIENLFTIENASLEMIKYLKQYKAYMADKLFFIFDEIENISIKTSPVAHWKSGEDFIPFWQTLRSIFQKETDLLSYLIIGTNPYSIEQSSINGTDNPIYNFITPEYIPGFNHSDVKEMVYKLGSIMGLHFEEQIFSKLIEDFGGHPFLIRQVCGIINTLVKESIKKPATIDRLIYLEAKKLFVQKNQNYIEMILNVLLDYYGVEYEMLEYLAIGDKTEFDFYAQEQSYTNHLIGYGILSKNDNNQYDFKVDLIKDFIAEKNKYKKKELSIEEKLQEISERRNKLEPKLRNLIKTILLSNLGKHEAKEFILNIFGGKRKNTLRKLSYSQLFNASKSEIYFSDLSKIISKKWDLFKNIFLESKQDTFQRLENINKYRNDAHAKEITEDEFILFRLSIEKIEQDLDES